MKPLLLAALLLATPADAATHAFWTAPLAEQPAGLDEQRTLAIRLRQGWERACVTHLASAKVIASQIRVTGRMARMKRFNAAQYEQLVGNDTFLRSVERECAQ